MFSKNLGNCLHGSENTASQKDHRRDFAIVRIWGVLQSQQECFQITIKCYLPQHRQKRRFLEGSETLLNWRPTLLKHQHFDGVLNLEHMHEFFFKIQSSTFKKEHYLEKCATF